MSLVTNLYNIPQVTQIGLCKIFLEDLAKFRWKKASKWNINSWSWASPWEQTLRGPCSAGHILANYLCEIPIVTDPPKSACQDECSHNYIHLTITLDLSLSLFTCCIIWQHTRLQSLLSMPEGTTTWAIVCVHAHGCVITPILSTSKALKHMSEGK